MPTRTRRACLAAAALTALCVAGCQGAGGGSSSAPPSGSPSPAASPAASPAPSPATSPPPAPGVETRAVTVRARDGMKLAGTAYGSGKLGVALFHESDTSQEVWRDYAPRLASRGLLVLAIDARGHGGSKDVSGSSGASGYGLDGEAAVAWLRAHGATRVALVGASIGGTMALTTAERAGAAAVVSLSGPATDHGQLDAIGGAARAPKRVLLVVGKSDRDFTGDADALAAAVRQAKLVVVDTSDHGTELLGDPAPGGTVGDLVAAFVVDALGAPT